MRTHARRVVWMLVIGLMALALTGCYRSAGEDIEPTSQVAGDITSPAPAATDDLGAQADTTPTPTTGAGDELTPTVEQLTPLPQGSVTPSLSPFPTLGPGVTATPLATQEGGMGVAPPSPTPTGVMVLTNTPLPTQGFQPTYTVQPTYTPFPTNTALPTSTPLPTYTPYPTNTSFPTNTPFPTGTPTNTPRPTVFGPTETFTPVPFMTFPPSPTWTPYYRAGASAVTGDNVMAASDGQGGGPDVPQEAQPLAERTQTGDTFGTGGPDVAATPAPEGVPQGGGTPPQDGVDGQAAGGTPVAAVQATPLSPGQMTATRIVYEATATIAALTGTPMPTLTPLPGQPGAVDPGQAAPAQPAAPAASYPGFPANATVITATPGPVGVCATHTIVLGETLYSIARRYNVTAEAIQAQNPSLIPTIDDISAGDEILIPCPQVVVTPTPNVPVVTSVPGTDPNTPTTGTIVHVVVPGDTLFSIARQYNVDVLELMALNGYTQANMNLIYEGDRILIPNQPVTPAPPVQPGVTPTLTPYIVIVTPAQ